MNTVSTPPRWSLDDLLGTPTAQALERAMSELEASVASVESARNKLAADLSAADFLNILHRYELLAEISSRLQAYSVLWLSEDTQNPSALNLRGRVEQALTAANNRTLFFGLWFKSLPDQNAQRFINASGDMRYYLESLRRFKPFTLGETEEKIINLKDVDGIQALVNVYEMLTNRFSFHLTVDGAEKTLTRDQLAVYFRHPAPEMRAAAYRELYRVYADNSTVLAQIYNHRARDWHSEAMDVRGYRQPISVRNLDNDLPDKVVDTLLDVCRQNAGLFQRYFRIKARALGLDRLRRYDIYAPFAVAEKEYDYAQATDMVLDSFRAFSPQLADSAARVMDRQHLDAEGRPGKRGGAFCYAPLPTLAPWVLVNYTGRARDVATLAHELGHAVHGVLAAKHSVLTFSPPLPLAETASVFGEMLLTERLLKSEQDVAVRREILAHSIDDAYATVTRQAYFTIFERDAHRLINEGGSFDDLTAAYLQNLKEQFGGAVEVSDEFKWEWISIPHIYNTPFYTYAYSFGQLLVFALYQQYRREGESFAPRYLNILSAGGSQSPADILAAAGLDMASAAFWQSGFDVVSGLIDELEQLSA